MLLKNSSINDSLFNKQSPVDFKILKPLGLYCVVLFIASFVSNTRLLVIFMKNKALITPINLVVIVHTTFNLIGTLIQLPLVTVNAFTARFNFGRHGCNMSAFVMYFVGCFSIILTTLLSLFRFLIAHNSFTQHPIKWKHTIGTLLLSISISLLFSLMPLFGWSSYTLEGAYLSCSINWSMDTLSNASYNITVLIVLFIIPFIILTFTNLKFFLIYKESRKRFRGCRTSKQARRFKAGEKKIKIVSTCLIASFLVSWTPYAIVSIYTLFFEAPSDPLLTTLCGLFAKSSLLWQSFFFMRTNKELFMKIHNNRQSEYTESAGINNKICKPSHLAVNSSNGLASDSQLNITNSSSLPSNIKLDDTAF